jgi:cell division protein FtsW (lipid II flippase)
VNSARRRIADPTLVALAMALSLFGIAMVYSAGQTDVTTVVAKLYRQQIAWFILGLGAAYAVSRASVRFLDWVTTPPAPARRPAPRAGSPLAGCGWGSRRRSRRSP